MKLGAQCNKAERAAGEDMFVRARETAHIGREKRLLYGSPVRPCKGRRCQLGSPALTARRNGAMSLPAWNLGPQGRWQPRTTHQTIGCV